MTVDSILDFMLHIDVHLNQLILSYGGWSYAILFTIVFSETGLVVAPFLPGDSLLFAAGALAASGSLDPVWLFITLSAAAIAGNTANYWIGAAIGPGVFKKSARFINNRYLERTHAFYEQHGGKTIVIARFLPIIRTFAPFVAGVGFMAYNRFMFYNVVAGIAWVGIFVFGGYLFGTLPAVKNHFTLVVAMIVIISLLPALYELIRRRRHSAP